MLKIDFENPVINMDMNEIYERLSEKEILNGKSVYITGANGMIASYLTAFLIWLNETKKYNIEIYAGVRNPEKAFKRFGEYVTASYFHIVCQDVTVTLSEKLKADFVVHAASLASPQYYGIYPVETMLPNVIGTYRLLEYCREKTAEGFLFFSSGAVYGNVEGVHSITEDTIGIMDYLSRSNVYGESKRCAEALCKAYSSEYDVRTTIARIHHTYGPTVDIDTDRRVFSEFAGNIIRGEDIVIKSSGKAERAFCYITDTVTGLLKILLSGGKGEVYNVGNPNEYVSINELAEILISAFPEKGLRVIKEVRNDADYVESGNNRNAPLNVTKLSNLGWNSIISIKEGFYRMIKAIEDSNMTKPEIDRL